MQASQLRRATTGATDVLERDPAVDARRSRGPGSWETLSKRETQVLRELATGKNNSEIARALYISPETVKKHVSNILGKTGAGNRVQAAVEAVRKGIA
jgi:DNA-binding CsgD family transcriptional regulator